MKKKSATQSAFLNPRVLIGLFMILAGVSLALFATAKPSGLGEKHAQQKYKIAANPANLIDISVLPPGFDCSKIYELGIDKQDNMRAGLIMITCGLAKGGSAPAGDASGSRTLSRLLYNLLPPPLFIGGPDADVILPDGPFPKVTQAESMEWGGPNNTWVVNYVDSRTSSGCWSGLSYSTDDGSTWTAGQPLCFGHGTNYGDPIVVYNARLGMWFAGDLATGCGGGGIGLWTSPDGITWTAGACAHNGSNDDRDSMWVDNNPASSFYGRMYISFNNFAVGGGALQVVYSDIGTTWTPPITLNGSFIRNIQVTGDLQGSGRVYVAAMNEGGVGGFAMRQNIMYRSTDGGGTWISSNAGAPFQPPGRAICAEQPYYVCQFSNTFWRHNGWGQPAASGNVVSLDYAACGTNVVCSGATDHGDVYYIRSTDAGVTWGTPVKLNTDTGTAMQWQPSLVATQDGALFASWYDQREVNGGADLNCTAGNVAQPCYRRWGRVSLDNGATWQPDEMVGRALSPLPAQLDPGVVPNFEGDYNYHSAYGTTAVGCWTDGRVVINGMSQQDVFVNFVPLVQSTPTPTATATFTPTATATATATATSTPTSTPTPTATVAPRLTPTPRPAPTPRPRPGRTLSRQ